MRTINGIEVDDFTFHYAICALWSSTDEEGEPLDDVRHCDDIHPDALKRMADDCRDFRNLEWQGKKVSGWLDSLDSTDEQDGHDFWLTRNGHGAGFWDRGYGKVGEILTDAAKSYGSCDLYVGDDGMIHAT